MNVRKLSLLSLYFLLAGCSQPPLTSKVTEFIAQHDTTYLMLENISVIEEMDNDQTALHYQRVLEEERKRLSDQYDAYANEPCISYWPNSDRRRILKICTLRDIEWMQPFMDTLKFHQPGIRWNSDRQGYKVWWEVYRKDILNRDKEYEAKQCLDILKERKAMLDNALENLKNEATLEYAEWLLNHHTSFSRLEATYLTRSGEKTRRLIARLNTVDTALFFSNRTIEQFIEPFKLPQPLVQQGNDTDLTLATSVSGGGDMIGMVNESLQTVSWDSVEVSAEDRKNNYQETGLLVMVDTTQGYSSHPVFIFNLTPKPVLLNGPLYILQAKDENGFWRPIEIAGGLYYEGPPKLKLYPYHIGLGHIKKYKGTFKTKLRVKFRTGLERYADRSNLHYFYSEPFEGNINPHQFNLTDSTSFMGHYLYDN